MVLAIMQKGVIKEILMAQSTQQNQSPIELDVAISVLTVPLLGGLVGARSLLQGMKTLGEASEEIFRGERLPIIHVEQQQERVNND